jgi:hypothetical protein
VAKATLWLRLFNTRQLTAISLGSKSRRGIGMRTLAMRDIAFRGVRKQQADECALAPALALRHIKAADT